MLRKAPPAARRLPAADVLFVATALLEATLVLSLRHLPYADATNVLARHVLIAQSLFGSAPADFHAVLTPTPYLGLDLFAATLVHLTSPAVAAKVLALLALLLPPVGFYLLLWAACPARRGWAVVGLLLSFNWFFFFGFLHYLIGWGLLLVWLAGYALMRRRESVPLLVALAVTAPLLLVVHLSAAIALLVVVGLDAVLEIGAAINERAEDEEAPLVSLRTAAPVAVAVPVLLLGFAMGRAMAPAPEGSGPEFRPLGDKLRHLLTPFYCFSERQCWVMAAGYLLALLVFLVAYRRSLRPGPLGLAALAFLALYFGFPLAVGGTYDLDVRFLLPALLLPFCAEGARDKAPGRPWWLLPWAACLVHFVFVAAPARAIDRDLAAYREALEALPRGSAVLPLVPDDPRHGRVRPYRHFAHWHLIERQGRVPGTLAAPEYTFYDHFRYTGPQLYSPGPDWGSRDFAPLDWAQIAAQYQFVVQAGEGPRAAELIAEHARPVGHFGAVTVYLVEPAPAPPESAGAGAKPRPAAAVRQVAARPAQADNTGRSTPRARSYAGKAYHVQPLRQPGAAPRRRD